MSPTLFGQLSRVFVTYRWRYLLGIVTVLGSNLLLVLNPLIFRFAVSVFDQTVTSPLHPSFFLSAYTWGALLLTVALASALLKYTMRVILITISRDAEKDLREGLFSRFLQYGQPFYDQYAIGDLMSRLTNDIALYRDVLGPGLLSPAYFLTLTIPAFIVLFFLSPLLALVSLIPILAIPPAMLLIRQVLFTYSKKVQEILAQLSTTAHESYSGIRLIKGYGEEKSFTRRFRLLCRQFLANSLRLLAAENLFYPFLRVIGKGVTVGLVLLAGFMILKQWSVLTAADFISFMWIQSYILIPVLYLGWIIPLYQRGRGAYIRLLEASSQPIETVGEGTKRLPAAPSLSFTDVTFAYPSNGLPVLSDVSFTIPSGKIVGITGPPGAGKSTLFSLLMRDYPLKTGEILLDGTPLYEYELHDLRRSIATVEQEPFLFSQTIGQNIALSREDASDKEIERVAQLAALHDTITAFPEGYDTLVGERGVTLSGGQKQRVAIARALLLNAPLFLFDDIFSALDTDTAAQIFGHLRTLRNTTALLITHRVAILRQVDEVLLFSHGKLVEQGRPADLEKQEGPFAALVALDLMEDFL